MGKTPCDILVETFLFTFCLYKTLRNPCIEKQLSVILQRGERNKESLSLWFVQRKEKWEEMVEHWASPQLCQEQKTLGKELLGGNTV